MAKYTNDTWPSDRWPNFSYNELVCKQSGLCDIDEDMMDALQELRNNIGRGLKINSGYRHHTHPIELPKMAKYGRGGAHTTGKAIDIACDRELAYNVLREALRQGFTGIGIKQKGDGRFIHLDTITDVDDFHVPRPTIWSY